MPCVRVVDDDDAVCKSLARLLRSTGLDVHTFPSAQAALTELVPERPGCMVLDLSMPEQSGLELQQALVREGCALPVIFLTGHGDVLSSVRAMKAGAVDFLTKPFEADALLGAVRAALERDGAARSAREERDAVCRRLAALTPRESEVLGELVQGKLNKQIAADLGAAEKTIKVHRARVLDKMKAGSIAALVRMTERAGLRDAVRK
jgi:FixJ family two-component response regulator